MTTPAFRPSPNLPRGLFADDDDLASRLYLIPCGMVTGDRAAAAVMAGTAWPVADGPVAFSSVAVAWREAGQAFMASQLALSGQGLSLRFGETRCLLGDWVKRQREELL